MTAQTADNGAARRRSSTHRQFFIAIIDIDRRARLSRAASARFDGPMPAAAAAAVTTRLGAIEVIHVGRDEFRVRGRVRDAEEASAETERARRAIAREISRRIRVSVTASAGFLFVTHRSQDRGQLELERRCRDALAEAKMAGRDRSVRVLPVPMRLKANYYTYEQLVRLARAAQSLQRTEASVLREALDRALADHERQRMR
jgi:GGDEF domain-containing protein